MDRKLAFTVFLPKIILSQPHISNQRQSGTGLISKCDRIFNNRKITLGISLQATLSARFTYRSIDLLFMKGSCQLGDILKKIQKKYQILNFMID